MTPPHPPAGNTLQLTLATGAFALCFAAFGSVSAMISSLQQRLGMSEIQAWIAIATPVLLGSLGRIPLGLLTDRFGGRVVFIWTMIAAIVPCVALGFVDAYWQLLVCGFFVGIGLASFSVGVGFTSRWYPPSRQGTALGIYGAGNIGQSLAAFGAPILAGVLGFAWGFWSFSILLTVWLVLFITLGRNAPTSATPRTFRESMQPLKNRTTWILSALYFLTFGGFVAMSIALPKFLTIMYQLTPSDAGLRTAGFVLLATVCRPLGGSLADRIGGTRVLTWVFAAVAVCAVFMCCPSITVFSVGALGMAAAVGLGNGAVFKLVPEHFPKSVGAVTGLVGAAGGLGGFFPPLLVGGLYELSGTYLWSFLPLSLASVACLFLTRALSRSQNDSAALASPATAS
jgi:MFS transporter, NNP family, nitrate/nitrite transporter